MRFLIEVRVMRALVVLLAGASTAIGYRPLAVGGRCARPRMAASTLPYSADSPGAGAEPDYTLISTTLLSQLLDCEIRPSTTKPLPGCLRNRYFALRHGLSEANVAGIISSDPGVGTTVHGLTAEGRMQARRSATRLLDLVGRENIESLIFYASGMPL